LPQIEKWQYVNGWPSGYGVQETAQFIKELNPDYILTEKSDLLRTGISYYQPLLSDKIIPIEDPWSNNLELFGITNEFMKDHKVVAAFHIIKNVPSGYNGKQIFNYIRPGNGDNLVVFEISTP